MEKKISLTAPNSCVTRMVLQQFMSSPPQQLTNLRSFGGEINRFYENNFDYFSSKYIDKGIDVCIKKEGA